MTASSRTLVAQGFTTNETRDLRLSSAWQAIIAGKGSQEDAELVLADLATHSGYYTVADPNTNGPELAHNEGRRAVFARILFLLDLPFSYMTELRRAAIDNGVVASME